MHASVVRMADKPWRNRKTTPGQVAQKLRSLGCIKTGELLSDSEKWKAPSGQSFWISLGEVDTEFFEKMVEQIETWINAQEKR
jgi:hypothetical protein